MTIVDASSGAIGRGVWWRRERAELKFDGWSDAFVYVVVHLCKSQMLKTFCLPIATQVNWHRQTLKPAAIRRWGGL